MHLIGFAGQNARSTQLMQRLGPPSQCPAAALNQQGGYFRDSSVLFWREGQGEWKQLGQLTELQQALQQAPPAGEEQQPGAGGGAEAAAAAAAEEEAPQGRRGKGAKAKAVPTDPELAGFLSEISALEAEAEAEASPPPEERQFEDDDGTVYVWDSALRKFMPQEVAAAATAAGAGAAGAAAAGAGTGGAAGGAAAAAAAAAAAEAAAYNEEDMVFVPDEEQLPAYEPPPKVGAQWEGPLGGAGRAGRLVACFH